MIEVQPSVVRLPANSGSNCLVQIHLVQPADLVIR